VSEELAGLVAMERTTASEDLHDEINKSSAAVEYSS
jgi:hypothetical protein